MAIYKSMSTLKEALQNKMQEAVNESINNLQENEDYFYPAGKNAPTIYESAEDNGSHGNDGVLRKITYEIEENIQKAFGKRFQ